MAQTGPPCLATRGSPAADPLARGLDELAVRPAAGSPDLMYLMLRKEFIRHRNR